MHPILYTAAYMMDIIAEGLRMALTLSMPMLLAAVAVGVAVSLFQAATQVQEQTLSFVPKIIATFIAVMMCAPWIATTTTHFMVRVLQTIPYLVVP